MSRSAAYHRTEDAEAVDDKKPEAQGCMWGQPSSAVRGAKLRLKSSGCCEGEGFGSHLNSGRTPDWESGRGNPGRASLAQTAEDGCPPHGHCQLPPPDMTRTLFILRPTRSTTS